MRVRCRAGPAMGRIDALPSSLPSCQRSAVGLIVSSVRPVRAELS